MTRLALVLAIAGLPAASALSCQMRSAVRSDAAAAAALLTPSAIGARISALAHDSMRGRDTPSPELDKAAAWIAAEFARFGLEPGGGPDAFVQRYTLERARFDAARSSGGFPGTARTSLAFGTDFLVVPFNDPRPGTVDGEVVALASPPTAEEDPLAGVDLDGKVLVQYSSSTDARLRLAVRPEWAEAGLAAIVWITEASDDVWNIWATRWNRSRLQIVSPTPGTPLVAVRAQSVEDALRSAGLDWREIERDARRSPVARPVPNVRARFTLATESVQRFDAPNVVGMLRGSDPALRDDYVVFSAHMDHVGVGRPVDGDSVYNGADDDASGTAAIMSLAEAFSALDPTPRRSMIFLTVSGEEKGLWGSQFFTDNPPVSIDRIVANINIDMIGRNWPDTIVAIGRQQSSLGTTLERVNAAHPDLGMTAIDDLWPLERFYYRSDHYNFARKGVPILFFFNGVHEDYHRPSDHPEKIDADKTSRIAKLLFWLGLDVANADERPRWDPDAYRTVVGSDRR